MKKLLLSTVIASAAFASIANAGTISLDLRADMNSSNYNDDIAKSDFYKYYLQTGRVDYKGSLSEETNFRLRWRFAGKNQTNVTTRDASNPTLDFAYVTQKMGPMLLLTAGKFSADIGAFEGAQSGADMYFVSEAYGGTSYLNPNDDLTGFGTELYYTGAKLAFLFADQEINIQTANSDTAVGRNVASFSNTNTGDMTDNNGFAQNKTLTAIVYKGNFIDKMLNVMASYHFETLEEKTKAQYMALGVQFKNETILGSLEYFLNTYDSSPAGTDLKDTLQSIVGTFKYSMGAWTPILKVAASEEKIDAGATNKYMDAGVALEYKPLPESIYRYHVAYNTRTIDSDDDTAASVDGANLQEVIVGMRVLADFLK